MLKELVIIKLFGLYDYKLTFQTQNNIPTFITGPNGYGKTTILNIIDRLYRSDFEYIRTLPFARIRCVFETPESDTVHHYYLHIDKILMENGPDMISFILRDGTMHQIVSDFTYPPQVGDDLSLFFNAEKHYYITDRRLTLPLDLDKHILLNAAKDNANQFKDVLYDLKESISTSLQVSQLKFTNGISNEDFVARKREIIQKFTPLINIGLISFEIPEYNKQNSLFLNATLDAYDNAYNANAKKIERIQLFQDIIKQYDFSNKQMQIKLDYGYRFVATNDERTILELEYLSSGEQHILVQTYDLLFNAPQGALVLVDEPELSAHLAWQALYLRTMKRIINLTKIQCLVATHSPMIFESNWDIAIDLYEQREQELL